MVSAAPAGTGVQLVPPSVEYCHAPWVAALAALPTIATPPSGVPFEPLATVSVASEYWLPVMSVLTKAPGGLVLSSLMAAKVAEPVATGASLTGVTVVPRVTWLAKFEYGVVPPVAAPPERFGPAPLVTAPEELSIKRTDNWPGVPFHWAEGTKRIRSVAFNR